MKESDLLRQSKELLKILETQNQLTWTRIHVIGMPRGKYRGKTKNVEMAGFSDLEIVRKGRAYYLETKHPAGTGKLTADQIKFKDRMERNGCPYCDAESLTDVVLFLSEVVGVDIPYHS